MMARIAVITEINLQAEQEVTRGRERREGKEKGEREKGRERRETTGSRDPRGDTGPKDGNGRESPDVQVQEALQQQLCLWACMET
jgi:hypothetical protein